MTCMFVVLSNTGNTQEWSLSPRVGGVIENAVALSYGKLREGDSLLIQQFY